MGGDHLAMTLTSRPAPPDSPRVAIVTGAARGIGAATVRALAQLGWAVLAPDRCASDPRLPYDLATKSELDAAIADARTLAGNDDTVVPFIGDARR
jgi:NAD(P)-dependent dehydrogenase (short-subunit alcohol dehydrogenase family)